MDQKTQFIADYLKRRGSISEVRLGVLPELIEHGKPQQNGRDERMHRTLNDV